MNIQNEAELISNVLGKCTVEFYMWKRVANRPTSQNLIKPEQCVVCNMCKRVFFFFTDRKLKITLHFSIIDINLMGPGVSVKLLGIL